MTYSRAAAEKAVLVAGGDNALREAIGDSLTGQGYRALLAADGCHFQNL